ncbi:DUF6415 family natural product biosynthesis protein [Streptomyces sp. NPDC004732]|uniref:DUF6415 family natural product biosynthesis protein n=1 Tax=Streptomyces sp. NPDC004732 TaxID=3154290 RepID=UPI0033B0C1DA
MIPATSLSRRTPSLDRDVERARPGDREVLERLVAGLRRSATIDLVALAHLDDDVEAALGERAPSAERVIPLCLRLRSAVAQLVDLVMQETSQRPTGAVADAVLRACEVLAESLPAGEDDGLGHLRRVALAGQGILDQEVIADEVLDLAATHTAGDGW